MGDFLTQPIIQYGFLGFSAVLLAMVGWLVWRLLAVLEANNKVISDNTLAINRVLDNTDDLLTLNRSLHDKIISRPCIAGLRQATL